MKGYCYLILLVVPALALPVQAGIFTKKAKPAAAANPDQRLPELLVAVKGNPEEAKRIAAAHELRDFDANVYTDIVPTLIDVLQHDKQAGVRREAAASLGKARPTTPAAAQALEQAASKDPSWPVRLQAWSSLKMSQVGSVTSRSKEPQMQAPPQPIQPQGKVAAVPAPGKAQPPLAAGEKIVVVDEKGRPINTPAATPAPARRGIFGQFLPQTQTTSASSPAPVRTTPAPQRAPSRPLLPTPLADEGPVLSPQN